MVEGTDYKVKLTEGGSKVGPAEAEIELTDTAAKNYNLISTNGTKYTVKFNVTAEGVKILVSMESKSF